MPVIKVYDKSHLESQVAARKRMRKVKQRVEGAVTVPTRKRGGKAKQDEAAKPADE